MKIIDLEAHFMTPEYVEFLKSKNMVTHSSAMDKLVLDTGAGRLKIMDNDGITMQVLDLSSPHMTLLDANDGVVWSRKVNNQLAEIVNSYPDRYAGLAAIAPQSPDEAARELERAVTQLGLKGVSIKSHARNEYLDDKKYWPIFETAEKLDVPIHMHPSFPSSLISKPFADYGFALAGAPFGFAADLSLHVMRLILSGLFDKYPGLKIILGHMGEGLPYWLPRLDCWWGRPDADLPKIKRKPSEYIKSNFTMAFSGLFFQPALICAYLGMGPDNIAFAVDYPFEKNREAVKFIEEAPICDLDKEKICHGNAERLLHLV